ncbi:YitT family protein [Cohnella suwonensis]|uniref:YitT family protein n=1 Tax=Cohnella suwonensis TaxID=696072 RepID=A0ABW0LP04_9BACL
MNARTKEIGGLGLRIALGCIVTAIGLIVLKHSGVITGGSAGIALGLSYLLGVKFHFAFLLINLPLVVFSYLKLGRGFTLRSLLAIVLLTAFSSLDQWLPRFELSAIVGALAGGAIIGIGIDYLFKARTSMGGTTVIVMYFQQTKEWNPGKTNFVIDGLTVFAGFSALPVGKGFFSILSIAATSSVISFLRNRSLHTSRSGAMAPSTAAAA